MTTDREPVRLVMNIATEDWDEDMADLFQAWRRGYTPPPRNLPEGRELLARLQWHLAATSDEELKALACLALADPAEARYRLHVALSEAAATPTPNH